MAFVHSGELVWVLTIADRSASWNHEFAFSSYEAANKYAAAYCRGFWASRGLDSEPPADDEAVQEEYFRQVDAEDCELTQTHFDPVFDIADFTITA